MFGVLMLYLKLFFSFENGLCGGNNLNRRKALEQFGSCNNRRIKHKKGKLRYRHVEKN